MEKWLIMYVIQFMAKRLLRIEDGQMNKSESDWITLKYA